MTEAEARRRLDDRLTRTDFEEGRSYLTPTVKGLAFMLLDSRIARVDVLEGRWATRSGAGIGTSESEIRRLYPQARTEPPPYLDAGKGFYLRIRPGNPALRRYELLFETDGGLVTSFRAGLSKAVSLIEGCA
jgi:hypothetical protein